MTLGIAGLASDLGWSTAGAATGTTETLSLFFVTPSLGWRLTDRWNPDTGARGPLEVWRTTNGGNGWQQMSIVTAASSGGGTLFNLYASRLVFADERDGWLYGDALFATHDGGRTWRRLPLYGSRTLLSGAGRSMWRLDWSCNSSNVCRYHLLAAAAGSNAWYVVTRHLPKILTLMGSFARSGSELAWLITGPFEVKNRYTLGLSASTRRRSVLARASHAM